MSSGLVQEAPETMEQLEQHHIIERASVEPESLSETAHLLGHSKRPFPKRIALLYAILVLFVLSVIAPAPASLDILYRVVCHFLNVEDDKCLRSDIVTERVAGYIEVETVISGIATVIISTYLSTLSDRLGRKPIILGAITLMATASLCTWYLVFYATNLSSYWWLMVPNFIGTLGGGMPLVLSLTASYISDVVPDPGHRARVLSVLDGCFSASIAVGPTLGSYIIRRYGIETLFICSCIGAYLAAFLTSIFLKESLSNYHKRRNSTNKRSVTSSLSLLKFGHIENGAARKNARILVVLFVVGVHVSASFIGLIALYPRRAFGWTAIDTGYMISAMSATRTFLFLCGFPLIYSQLSKLWEVRPSHIDKVDLFMLRVGAVFSVLGYLSMGWSRNGGQYFSGGIVDAFSSIGRPIFTSALIKYVPAGQYGSFMAALNLTCSTISILGPTIFLKLYTWVYLTRPSFPFEVISIIFVALIFATLMLKPSVD